MTTSREIRNTDGSSSNRIESLDSIRGLAALIVLLGHCLGVCAWPLDLAWLDFPVVNAFVDGRTAVTMFFVLSGFVLSLPYFSKGGDAQLPAALSIFYLRRFIRIWLPWFGAFLISALAQRYFFHPFETVPPISPWLDQFWHCPFTFGLLLKQSVFILHDYRQQLLPQDWSLGVELKGSALIPLFLYLLRRNIGWLLGAAALLLLILPTGEYYVSFAIGILTSQLYRAKTEFLGRLTFGQKFSGLVLGLLLYDAHPVMLYVKGSGILVEKAVWCTATVGCALIILASLCSRRIGQALNLGSLTSLGRISYSVYLLQFVVLLCWAPGLVWSLNRLGITDPSLILIATVGLSVFFTLAGATVFYRLVEMPTIRLGHLVSARLKARKSRDT